MSRPSLRRIPRPLLVAAFAASLAGCGALPDREPPSGEPSFYRSLAKPGAELDVSAAQAMISGYRRNNGLSEVRVDPRLMRIAAEHARAMAAQNRLAHTVAGRTFQDRMRGSGFNAASAGENIGAGYHTLAEAFSGWRGSPHHRANMLRKGATHMGIAAVYAPKSKYKVFWCLVLAGEDERPGS